MKYLLWPTLLLSLVSLLVSACEEVTVFGESQKTVESNTERSTVGSCMSDEDCPQWACVSSTCIEGECVPKRGNRPELKMDKVLLDEPVVSVSVFASQMVALVGEPNTDQFGPHSLGTGQKLLAWSLETPYPDENADLMSIKAYETADWIPKSSWTPSLQRTSYMASLDPEDPVIETKQDLELRAVTLQDEKLWIHAGPNLKDLWWGEFGQSESNGRYFRLAAPVQAVTSDEDEAWVSVYDKGLERLSLVEEAEVDPLNQESNARFNTPGRALFSQAGRSFVIVADGYAGLSLFLKRAQSTLDQASAARRLVTPPQELSSQSRSAHLDLIEDRVISAEYGSGIRVTRISSEGSLVSEIEFELGGTVRWVKWIDPYTALAWVDGRGVLALDLLTSDLLPKVIAELNTDAADYNEALVWSAHGRRFALLTNEGSLYQGRLSCTE